jgi:hypothetical protein
MVVLLPHKCPEVAVRAFQRWQFNRLIRKLWLRAAQLLGEELFLRLGDIIPTAQ